MKIGFIGQGWVGKNYADDFVNRGYDVVRYSIEPEYKANKSKIASCDLVFVAVPTPTTKKGFDVSILEDALKNIKTVAVIKSTIVPGTTVALQKKFPKIKIVHSPEFLVEVSAAHDAAHPDRNIIGIPVDNKEYRDIAKKILSVLPKAPFTLVCKSEEAEIIKYAHNVHGYMQIIFSNILYDLSIKHGGGWDAIKEAIKADPMMSHYYLNPIHKSGRGAGGGCFIKDFAAFLAVYEKTKDKKGTAVLKALEAKNIELLKASKKDLPTLKSVYGNV